MKTRIFAAVLAVMMLVGLLPMTIFAANPTLKDKIDSGDTTIIISSPTDVTESTVIPEGVTVIVLPGALLNVNSLLTVEGTLTIQGPVTNPGNIYYNNNGYGNGICPTCRLPYVFCGICNDFYCSTCMVHTHGIGGSTTTSHYCNEHQISERYCDICGVYYCYACVGTRHSQHETEEESYTCSAHGIVSSYCSICEAYYCTVCNGGYHRHSAAQGGTLQYCVIHTRYYVYCPYCVSYYCPDCTGSYHTHSSNSTTYYCTIHSQYKQYCPSCNSYICTACLPSHSHLSTTNYCSIHQQYRQFCPGCNAFICVACTPNHSHAGVSDTICSVHNIARLYCSVCQAYYCPTCIPNHTHAGIGGVVTPPTANICPIHATYMQYCAICQTYFCNICLPNHGHSTDSSTYYCSIHNINKVYCPACQAYYCTGCVPGHTHMGIQNPVTYYCSIHNANKIYCAVCNYYYCLACQGGTHYHTPYGGGISGIFAQSCVSPVASIPSGTEIVSGKQVTLSTSTDGASIYYTTDGSNPSVSGTLYSGPITITKNTTLHAIAVKSGLNKSNIATFVYEINAKLDFTDVSSDEKLSDNLAVLVAEGVIENGSKFNPKGAVTLSDTEAMFKNIFGVNFSKAGIADKNIKDKNNLTNEELVYVLYAALRSEDLIASPKGKGTEGTKVFQTLNNYKDVSSISMFKAAYVSFIQNDIIEDLSIKPNVAADRAYLAEIMVTLIENIEK